MAFLTGKKRYRSYNPGGVTSLPKIVLQVEEGYYEEIPGCRAAAPSYRWRDAALEDLTEFNGPIQIKVEA